MKLADENARLKTENETTKREVTAQEIETGSNDSIKFMQAHPEFAVTVYPGEKLEDVMANIYRSGEAHPEYENFLRFTAVLKTVSDGIYPSFDDAHKAFFGGTDSKKAANEQVVKNQAKGKPEEPAGKTTPPTGGTELINRMAKRGKGPGYAKLNRA